MEEDDKWCLMIRMGVSGWVFLLVPAYPGCPRSTAIKRLCVCVWVCVSACDAANSYWLDVRNVVGLDSEDGWWFGEQQQGNR